MYVCESQAYDDLWLIKNAISSGVCMRNTCDCVCFVASNEFMIRVFKVPSRQKIQGMRCFCARFFL